MKVKILNIIFIASLLLNVYFILKNTNIHKIKEEESILSYLQLLNLEEEKEVSNDNVDIIENNPIDNFFDEHKLSKVNSFTLRRVMFLYMQSWKNEMDNAYDILIKAGHDNIKDSVKESWSKFAQYAESEADVGVGVYASDAFGNETGKHGETITYGTIGPFQRNATLARLYKKRTIEIFEYFRDLGIEVEFAFDENSFSEEDLELFH